MEAAWLLADKHKLVYPLICMHIYLNKNRNANMNYIESES